MRICIIISDHLNIEHVVAFDLTHGPDGANRNMAFAKSLYGACGSITGFYDTSHRHPKRFANQNNQA